MKMPLFWIGNGSEWEFRVGHVYRYQTGFKAQIDSSSLNLCKAASFEQAEHISDM